MKKIFYIVLGVAALLAAASCEKNREWNNNEGSGQGLTLSFTCGNMATRAVVGVNNENLVKRIDYFFFPYGTDGKVDPNAEYVWNGSVVPGEGHELEMTYRETISPGVLNKIFPDGNTKAVVMAIANYVGKYGPTAKTPETTIPDSLKTWKQLHELEVGPTFFKDGGPGFQLRWPRRLNPTDSDLFFVMAADSVSVELNKTGQYAIDAKVPLKRLASKVTAEFTFVASTDDKGVLWIPQYQEDSLEVDGIKFGQDAAKEARVYLSSGIEHTTIGGPLTRDLVADSWGTATQPLGNGNRDVFEYAYDFLLDIEPDANNKLAAHYYTYPISMEEGDDNQPYLKLVLPWYGYVNRGSASAPVWVKAKQKEVYYKIVLPYETISESNMIYEYFVTVNIAGNEKEVQITGEEYRVKDWSSDKEIDNNVGLGRYISLDIPKDTYDMYSSLAEIMYVSSGEVEISHLEIYDQNLTGTTAVNRYFINGTPTSYVNPYNQNTEDDKGNKLPNWVTIQGTQLVVNHTLHTALDRSVNISPFKFVVTLHLKGIEGTQFDRTVTITQYPPIYAQVVSTSNMNTVFLNGTVYDGSSDNVNNNATESLGYIGNSQGAKTRTIVSVTTLANLDVTKYTNLGVAAPVIGDPRITLAGNYPENPYVSGESWEVEDLGNSSNGFIADYQYADINKSNVIAPKFMLASGYGGCNGNKVDWVHNVERCASYQEDGYPAGRWRLPTEAEIVFVYTLAHDLKLLSNPYFTESHYWSNAGRQFCNSAFDTTQHGTSGQNATGWSSRCVYDLWYWGDDPVLSTTTSPRINQWSGFMTSK